MRFSRHSPQLFVSPRTVAAHEIHNDMDVTTPSSDHQRGHGETDGYESERYLHFVMRVDVTRIKDEQDDKCNYGNEK
jgi:hypothetical protein